MLGKVEAPILILAFLYIAIIVVVLIFLTLFLFSCTGVFDFMKKQELAIITRHCGMYTQQNKPSMFDSCVKQAANYK
jgi:uncharacterized membrane protein YqiK